MTAMLTEPKRMPAMPSAVTQVRPADSALALKSFLGRPQLRDRLLGRARCAVPGAGFRARRRAQPRALRTRPRAGRDQYPTRQDHRIAAWHSTRPDTVFVVYCAGPHCNGAHKGPSGSRSLGRPVKLMIGGITGWRDEGFDLRRLEPTVAIQTGSSRQRLVGKLRHGHAHSSFRRVASRLLGVAGCLRLAATVALHVTFTSAHAMPRDPSPCTQCAEWNVSQEPFRIYGNTYYVGVHGLSSILITSPQGHVLIDGDLPESAPKIAANIRALGFRIKDVKLILNSHVHYDHAGGIAELHRLSGATVAASKFTARALEIGRSGPDDPQYGILPPIQKVAA